MISVKRNIIKWKVRELPLLFVAIVLYQVFWKARQRCREDLNEQLADFRNKRSAGLGSIFGPRDHVLEESIHNKAKELQIVEHLLVPCLESVS